MEKFPFFTIKKKFICYIAHILRENMYIIYKMMMKTLYYIQHEKNNNI